MISRDHQLVKMLGRSCPDSAGPWETLLFVPAGRFQPRPTFQNGRQVLLLDDGMQ
jgi:hypothetical protein